MARKSVNIFPGLAAQMAYKYHDNYKLAEIIGVGYDSVLRRLSGDVDFELSEIKKLMKEYNVSFSALFEVEQIAESLQGIKHDGEEAAAREAV